jgi:hypothetical protein
MSSLLAQSGTEVNSSVVFFATEMLTDGNQTRRLGSVDELTMQLLATAADTIHRLRVALGNSQDALFEVVEWVGEEDIDSALRLKRIRILAENGIEESRATMDGSRAALELIRETRR